MAVTFCIPVTFLHACIILHRCSISPMTSVFTRLSYFACLWHTYMPVAFWMHVTFLCASNSFPHLSNVSIPVAHDIPHIHLHMLVYFVFCVIITSVISCLLIFFLVSLLVTLTYVN